MKNCTKRAVKQEAPKMEKAVRVIVSLTENFLIRDEAIVNLTMSYIYNLAD